MFWTRPSTMATFDQPSVLQFPLGQCVLTVAFIDMYNVSASGKKKPGRAKGLKCDDADVYGQNTSITNGVHVIVLVRGRARGARRVASRCESARVPQSPGACSRTRRRPVARPVPWRPRSSLPRVPWVNPRVPRDFLLPSRVAGGRCQ